MWEPFHWKDHQRPAADGRPLVADLIQRSETLALRSTFLPLITV